MLFPVLAAVALSSQAASPGAAVSAALQVVPVRTLMGIRPLAFASAPSGSKFVATLEDRNVRIYDATTQMPIRDLKGHPQPSYAVAWSRDGKLIATGDESGRIFVWNAASGAKLREVRPHTRGVQALSFNPTGSAILSTGKDDWLKITELKTGKVIKALAGAGQNFYSGKYLPSGEAFIVGTLGKGAQIRHGAKFVVLMGHSDYSVFDVDYHGPSGRVLTAGRDGNAIVWNGRNGQRIQTLKGHGDWVVHTSFLPSGRFGATSSSDRTVRVWDMRSFKPVVTLENQTAVGSPICATSDGRYLVTVNLDDFMQIHALKPSQPGAAAPRRRGR